MFGRAQVVMSNGMFGDPAGVFVFYSLGTAM
jgi:hypothetical protein